MCVYVDQLCDGVHVDAARLRLAAWRPQSPAVRKKKLPFMVWSYKFAKRNAVRTLWQGAKVSLFVRKCPI